MKYLVMIIIGAFGLGMMTEKIREKDPKENRVNTIYIYDMKTIPNELVLSCFYMIENEEEKAKLFVDVYNSLNGCKND